MRVKEFTRKVIDKMTIKQKISRLLGKEKEHYLESITDRVFVYIEENEDLYKEYIALGKEKNNDEIGMEIKNYLGLGNKNKDKCVISGEKEVCSSPTAISIKTYTKHCEL